MTDVDPDLAAELLRLEGALADRDPGGVDGDLADLIAEDFVEIGRSGRTWTATSVREVLGGPPTPVPIDDVDLASLADGIVLVTYRTPGTRRSSIWVRRAGRWQIRFHQGTPTAGRRTPTAG